MYDNDEQERLAALEANREADVRRALYAAAWGGRYYGPDLLEYEWAKQMREFSVGNSGDR